MPDKLTLLEPLSLGELHLPNRIYLLHRAFKDLPESSPHRLGGLEPGLVMASAPGAAVAGGRRG